MDRTLFISLMAFILALFSYFKNYTENLVPGFEQKMKSNWVITGKGGSEDEIVMAYRNSIKFRFTPDGIIKCSGVELRDKCECNQLIAQNSIKTEGPVNCSTITAQNAGKISNWRIKHDRMGIQGKGDLVMGEDQYLRMMTFDGSQYAGSPGRGGFAGYNLWSNVEKQGRCICRGYGGAGTPVVPHKHKKSDVPHSHGWNPLNPF